MIASILGSLVSDIFRKAVRAVFALTFIGIGLLGAGLATGTIHTDDLRPESIHKALAFCQDRVEMMKGFAGELAGVDYTGVVRGMREREQALEELGAMASPYDDIPLDRLQELAAKADGDLRYSEDEQDETDGEGEAGEVVRAGIF
jgi:hypothetical protein